MSSLKKTYEKIIRIPKDMTFNELHNFLTNEKVGFKYRIKGSHYNYVKDGVNFTVPSHGVLKAAYLKEVVMKLEEIGFEVENV